MKPPLAFSFSGCGLLSGYHLGVWEALARNGRRRGIDISATPHIGASGGALIAGAMVSGVPSVDAAAALRSIVTSVRSAGFGGILRVDLLSLVRIELERLLPAKAHERCSNVLSVCLSDASGLPWRRPRLVLHSEWPTRSALIDSLLTSSYIPLITSREHQQQHRMTTAAAGEEEEEEEGQGGQTRLLVDGGLSANFPLHPTALRTVRVSPFAGEVDICPASRLAKEESAGAFRILPRRLLLPAGVRVDLSMHNASAALRAFVPAAAGDLTGKGGDDDDRLRDAGYNDACRWLEAQRVSIF